jgi:ADP-ribosyl-[dinitrogen reductase] hydrolase
MTLSQRIRGSLLGLAAGDALGTTLEFRPPGSFEPLDDMVGGGPFGLAPGQWTDDTSLALCLAESLVERRGFDPLDQLRRYLHWWRHGHLSSTGACFDIGMTTAQALRCFERSGEPWCGPTGPDTAGNGSLMRLAPVPLAFHRDPQRAAALAGDSSRTTHGARECVDACRWYGALLAGAAAGASREELLAPGWADEALAGGEALCDTVAEVAAGSFLRREPPRIAGTGHVVRCLEAALWAFARADDFRHGALLAVNLGDDADTTGAVYGQLAGAVWGEEAIPAGWRQRLALRGRIEELADGLAELAAAGDLDGRPVPRETV